MASTNKEKPSILRFTGLGLQMLASIGIGITGGYFLDQYFQLKFPIGLLLGCLLGLGTSLFIVIKEAFPKK